MKRFDLRQYKSDFIEPLLKIMDTKINKDENGIFLFEIGDFSNIQKIADVVKENGYTLMNSLKFNEVDWTVVIKKSLSNS